MDKREDGGEMKVNCGYNTTAWRGVVLVLSVLITACEKPQEKAAPPRPALVMKVGASNANFSTAIVGEIRPRYQSAQGFRVAGKIIERRVEVGHIVHKGDVLARLDATDTALNTQVAFADVKAAEADYALVNAELARQRQLFAQKFISASALDAREASVKTAYARLQQAQSRAAVSSNQIKYTHLIADRDGVVTDIHAEPGQVVSAGEVVATIADLKQLEANVAVAESTIKGLKVGAPAEVRMWTDSAKSYQGKIREIAPSADAGSRTFLVKVSIVNMDDAVKLGMTAGVAFANTEENVAVLPTSAITQFSGKPAVWVVNTQTRQVHPRNVVIGSYREDGVPVKSGLTAGEQVVVAGVHILVDGQVVRPLEAGVAK